MSEGRGKSRSNTDITPPPPPWQRRGGVWQRYGMEARSPNPLPSLNKHGKINSMEKKRGGARAGAGRKRRGVVSITITLTPEQIAFLKELGKQASQGDSPAANASAGVRLLIEWYQRREEGKDED
jgi:hypothetical protein